MCAVRTAAEDLAQEENAETKEGQVGPGLRALTPVFEGPAQGLGTWSPEEETLWQPQSLGRVYGLSWSRPLLFI